MATAHRGPARPAARRGAEPVQRRRDPPHRRRLLGRSPLAGRAPRSPTDTKVQKTALGSQRFCTWTDHETSAEAATAARGAGYRIVGVELAEGATPLHELDLSGPLCLAIGHEDRGLSKEMLASCDALGYIPLLGRIGSLNVGTATAIACYEARRTAWTAPPA